LKERVRRDAEGGGGDGAGRSGAGIGAGVGLLSGENIAVWRRGGWWCGMLLRS